MQALLLVHAAATCALAGLAWTVHVVVYPGFALTGPTPAWGAVHAAHVRRITAVVAPPWAVQGVSVAALLLVRPSPLVVVTAALAAATVAATALVAVPAHDRLGRDFDTAVLRRLQRADLVRTVAWTAGAVCAVVLAA